MLTLDIYHDRMPATGGSTQGTGEVVVDGSEAAMRGLATWHADAPGDGASPGSTMEIEGRDLVIAFLGSPYDNGQAAVRALVSPAPFERFSVRVADDQAVLDAIAVTFVGCET